MYTVEKISNWDIRVDIQTNKPCQLYVDTFPSSPKQCLRVLWSVEPNEIAGLRDIVINRHKEFDLILTWHKEVLDNCSNARLFPHGMSWILDFDLTKENFTRINNDTNGNPRYVTSFLNLLSDYENYNLGLSIDGKYNLALRKAKSLGGKKFNNKLYGGGIVFGSVFNLDDLVAKGSTNSQFIKWNVPNLTQPYYHLIPPGK